AAQTNTTKVRLIGCLPSPWRTFPGEYRRGRCSGTGERRTYGPWNWADGRLSARDLVVLGVGSIDAQQLYRLVTEHLEAVLDPRRCHDHVACLGVDGLTVDGPTHAPGPHHQDVVLFVGV